MAGTRLFGGRLARRDIGSAVRVLVCILLVWAFLSGVSFLSVRGPAVLGVATVLSLVAAYELTLRDVAPGWVLGCILSIQAVMGGGYLAWLAFQPPPPAGALIAAGEPSPPPGCQQVPGRDDLMSGDLMPDKLMMLFGTDRVIGTGPGPFMPLEVDDCVVLNLTRRGGGLMVQAAGYDWSNSIVFQVINNVYEPVEPLQIRAFRPDRSTLVLLDRFDKEVLYVRYLNRGAVRIRGRFLCGEQPQVVIHDDVIWVGGVRIGGAFFGQHPTKGHVCVHIKSGGTGIAIPGGGEGRR